MLHLLAGDAENRTAEQDIFPTRELRVKAGSKLQQRRHAPADRELPGGRLQRSGKDLEERALTRSISTDDTKGLSPRDLK